MSSRILTQMSLTTKMRDCVPPKQDYTVSRSERPHSPRDVTSIYLSNITLQSFVGPWPLFQFFNPVHSR
jgi:hypothetical protein